MFLSFLYKKRITKEVDKDSKEAKKFVKDKEEAEKMKPDASTGTKRPGGGLASIMNVISGKWGE